MHVPLMYCYASICHQLMLTVGLILSLIAMCSSWACGDRSSRCSCVWARARTKTSALQRMWKNLRSELAPDSASTIFLLRSTPPSILTCTRRVDPAQSCPSTKGMYVQACVCHCVVRRNDAGALFQHMFIIMHISEKNGYIFKLNNRLVLLLLKLVFFTVTKQSKT